jgi:hypothetical protein
MWSNWIKIADYEHEYSHHVDDDGPACYELGLVEDGGSLFDVEPVYIGETCNLNQRISAYAVHGSHLCEIIEYHLKHGYVLFVRVQLFDEKSDAKMYQDKKLDKWDYDWNIQRNSSQDEEE